MQWTRTASTPGWPSKPARPSTPRPPRLRPLTQDWPTILAHLRQRDHERQKARSLKHHPPPPQPPNLHLLRSASRKLTARRPQPAQESEQAESAPL